MSSDDYPVIDIDAIITATMYRVIYDPACGGYASEPDWGDARPGCELIYDGLGKGTADKMASALNEVQR